MKEIGKTIKEFGTGLGLITGLLIVVFYLNSFSNSKVSKMELDNFKEVNTEQHEDIKQELRDVNDKLDWLIQYLLNDKDDEQKQK